MVEFGHNFDTILGLLVVIFIIVPVAIWMNKKLYKNCPFCKEQIDKDATTCPRCTKDLP